MILHLFEELTRSILNNRKAQGDPDGHARPAHRNPLPPLRLISRVLTTASFCVFVFRLLKHTSGSVKQRPWCNMKTERNESEKGSLHNRGRRRRSRERKGGRVLEAHTDTHTTRANKATLSRGPRHRCFRHHRQGLLWRCSRRLSPLAEGVGASRTRRTSLILH